MSRGHRRTSGALAARVAELEARSQPQEQAPEFTYPDLFGVLERAITRAMPRIAPPPGGWRDHSFGERGEGWIDCMLAVAARLDTGAPLPVDLEVIEELQREWPTTDARASFYALCRVIRDFTSYA
ncbi:hypothetical protein [Thiomonas sp.]|uniref:hypothetical protein n=1 Tax=Thiomonas sp. TaxID=2047785 RepID=UPI0025908339|nr:hypothetical protein [Thiomonas sp.]